MNTSRIYTVRVTRRAEQDLRRLPNDVISRIDQSFEQVRQNPRPHGLLNLLDNKIHIGD